MHGEDLGVTRSVVLVYTKSQVNQAWKVENLSHNPRFLCLQHLMHFTISESTWDEVDLLPPTWRTWRTVFLPRVPVVCVDAQCFIFPAPQSRLPWYPRKLFIQESCYLGPFRVLIAHRHSAVWTSWGAVWLMDLNYRGYLTLDTDYSEDLYLDGLE